MAACAECGEANAAAARFCHACGAAFQDEVGAGFEIRKTVTILFCDVVGSTALGERTDPETTRKVMSRYAHEMSAVVERHGGTVERFRGDEVMAVFGVPTVHEDDALRAVRAGKEMQRRLATLNEELVATWGVRLECRIGINTGEVVAADPARNESFVTGDAVNVAKRLEQAARPGEILIGTATYPLVKDAGKFGPRYRFSVKGKREPVTPFRLDDVDATAAGYARRLDAPFVGRPNELAELRAHFDRSVADHRCTLVLVLGPAGIGKSRLVREATSTLAGRAEVVTGRCLSYGTGITYWPLVEILDGLGGLEALEQALADREDAEAVLAPLRAALGVAESDVPSDEVFWAVRRMFEYRAERRPLVVCLDDAHWAEPTLLDLVEYLAAFATGPIVLLCIARAEILDSRSGLGSAPRIELEQLREQETEELVAALGVDDARVRAQIAATADGNPLFAEQLTAAVAESDTPADVDALKLPASISALLEARLDGLEPAERRALERAAIAGKEFWQRAVADLSSENDRPAVARSLLALVRKGLIRPTQSRVAAQDVYRFRHTLIREAAYAGMPKAIRASLHERFAAWLQLQPRPGAAQDEILGYHLEQAYVCLVELAPLDDHGRMLAAAAGERLAAAGRRAITRDDVPAAVNLLERAFRLIPEGDPGRLEVQFELSRALWSSGDSVRAAELLDGLLVSAEAAEDRRLLSHARMERLAQRGLTHVGDELELLSEAEEARQVFEEIGDHLGLARVWRRIAFVNRLRGSFGAATEAAERALAHAEAAGDAREKTRIVDGLCTSLLYGPVHAEQAIRRCEEIRDAARGQPGLVAAVLSSLSGLVAMRGRFDEARDLYGQAKRLWEELGLRYAIAGLTEVAGEIELLAGDPLAAEHELLVGAEILAALQGSPAHDALLALALVEQGRDDEAGSFAAAAVGADLQHQLQANVVCHEVKATIASRADRHEQAIDLAKSAVALTEESDALNLHASALSVLGRCLRGSGREAEGTEKLEAAFRFYEAKGNSAAMERLAAEVRQPVE